MSADEPTLADFDNLIAGLVLGKRPRTRWKRLLNRLGLYREEYTEEEVVETMKTRRLSGS